ERRDGVFEPRREKNHHARLRRERRVGESFEAAAWIAEPDLTFAALRELRNGRARPRAPVPRHVVVPRVDRRVARLADVRPAGDSDDRIHRARRSDEFDESVLQPLDGWMVDHQEIAGRLDRSQARALHYVAGPLELVDNLTERGVIDVVQ